MIKDIAIALTFKRATAWEFAKVVEDTQTSVIVAVAVYIAGIHHRLNCLPNIMNMNY